MRTVRRKGPLIGAVAFLIMAGVALGAFATTTTRASLKWQPSSQFHSTEHVIADPVDHGAAGRSWARAAYDGGLRKCPDMNKSFVAACEAEMKALAARPNFVPGSYGGPLLVTKVEPVTLPDTYEPYEPGPMPLVAPEPVPEVIERTPDNYPAAPPPIIASEAKQTSVVDEPAFIASSLRSSR